MTGHEVTKDHLSVSELAIRLGVSECTVRRWAKAGKLRAFQPAGSHGMYRFPLDCFEQSHVALSPKAAADGRLSGPKPKWLLDDT